MHSAIMETIDDVFEAFGGISALAEDLGKEYSTVACWRATSRRQIPRSVWPDLIVLGLQKRIKLSMADLIAVESNEKSSRTEAA